MKRETMKKVAKSFPHGWDVGSSNERERMEGGAARCVRALPTLSVQYATQLGMAWPSGMENRAWRRRRRRFP